MTRNEPELFADRENFMLVMHKLNNYIDHLKQEITNLQDAVCMLDGRMQSLIIQFELMKSGKGASDTIFPLNRDKNEETPPEKLLGKVSSKNLLKKSSQKTRGRPKKPKLVEVYNKEMVKDGKFKCYWKGNL